MARVNGCALMFVCSDDEAVRLIQMEPPQKKTSGPVITDEGSIHPSNVLKGFSVLCGLCFCGRLCSYRYVLSGPPDDQLDDENDPFTSTNTEVSYQ